VPWKPALKRFFRQFYQENRSEKKINLKLKAGVLLFFLLFFHSRLLLPTAFALIFRRFFKREKILS